MDQTSTRRRTWAVSNREYLKPLLSRSSVTFRIFGEYTNISWLRSFPSLATKSIDRGLYKKLRQCRSRPVLVEKEKTLSVPIDFTISKPSVLSYINSYTYDSCFSTHSKTMQFKYLAVLVGLAGVTLAAPASGSDPGTLKRQF